MEGYVLKIIDKDNGHDKKVNFYFNRKIFKVFHKDFVQKENYKDNGKEDKKMDLVLLSWGNICLEGLDDF